jgi:hypothetical protein
MRYSKKPRRSSKFVIENQELFEEISGQVLSRLDYAELVDEGLATSKLSTLLIEEIDKGKLEELEKQAKQAKTDIDEFISELSDLGMGSTIGYLSDLKGDLPGSFGLVKLAMFGEPEEAAEKIGEVTSISTKLQLAKDSVAAAIELIGNELGKMPFADKKNWDTFRKEKANDAGEIEFNGETISIDDIQKALDTETLQNILDKAEELREPLAEFQFPSAADVFNAAKSKYQPPEKDEPTGLWGKLMGAFGKGDLSADEFATDIMAAPLAKLIEKAGGMATEADEAEAAKQNASAAMQDIEADLANLGQGKASAVDKSGAPSGEVDIPGIGRVPLTADTLRRIFPGIDATPDEVAKRKTEKIPDLARTVVEPEGLDKSLAAALAKLINDDNKSPVTFADPEEAKTAVEEEEKAEPAQENAGYVPRGNIMIESPWMHKRDLGLELFGEAIFYKDVAKVLKVAVGASDELETEDDIPKVARELAKRLQNQYDIEIIDIPEKDDNKKESDKKEDAGNVDEGDKEAEKLYKEAKTKFRALHKERSRLLDEWHAAKKEKSAGYKDVGIAYYEHSIKLFEALIEKEELRQKAGKGSKPGEISDAKEEIKDAKRRLGELQEILRHLRGQVLGRPTYYKQGMLSEVLIGVEPRRLEDEVENEELAARMLRLAGLGEE